MNQRLIVGGSDDEDGFEYLSITDESLIYILIEGDYAFINICFNKESIKEALNAGL